MQEFVPLHAVDEAWAAKLEEQACAWKAARSERRSATDSGVLVIRRSRRTYGTAYRPLDEQSARVNSS